MGRSTVYNNIVTDEKYEKVCQDNKDLLDEFIEYCHTTDKSDATVKGYISDIKIYFCWNLDNNKNKFFANIKKRDVMKYQNYLMNELDLGSSRVRRLKSSLSSMSNFIEAVLDEEEEYEDFRNIINKIPAPIKSTRREKTVLLQKDVDKVLDYLVDKKQYQKACAFALAIASGSRKSELTRFKHEWFSDENIVFGCMYKTPEEIKTKGRGKQGKKLKKYTFIDQFKPYFDLWMKQREELEIDSEWLFVTKPEGEYKQASSDIFSHWAKQYSKILETDFYFHSCRHFWTSKLSQSGIPASVIKELQGWSSTDMVELYDDTEIDETLGQYFDENGIKDVQEKSLKDL